MRKTYLLLLIFLATVLPANAVLKEANIDSTLNVLRLELSNYRNQLNRQSGDLQRQNEEVGYTLMNVMNKSN